MRQLELITSHTPEIRKDCFLLSVANVKGILGFSVQSIILADLLGNTCYLLKRVHKVMVFNLQLVDFDLFVLFLHCFKVRCL